MGESAVVTPTLAASSRPALRRWWIAGGVSAAVIVAVVALWPRGGRGRASAGGPTAVVMRSDLIVSITGSNSQVEAASRKVIRNELRWPVIIKGVVPDGTRVEKGEVIIHFECAELEDAIEDGDLAVDKAELTYEQAVENLKLKKKEMDSQVRKATQAVKDAGDNITRYTDKDGQWGVDKNDAESRIELASGDLALVQGRLNAKLKANNDPELQKPYSKSEIEKDRLDVKRLKRSLRDAESNLDMLIKYDHPRRLRDLNTAVDDAKLNMERANLVAATEVRLAKSNVEAKRTHLRKLSERLAERREDKELRLTVRAMEPGLVVYSTGGLPWRPSPVSVEVGEKINQRQQLMIIPDMSTLQVETKVFEAVVNQLKPGATRALVSLDAKPELNKLGGTVKWVAPLPDPQHGWMATGVKLFSVVIKFDNAKAIPDLKPGMTAQVELMVARLPNVLSVPVAAVWTEQEKTYCWRATNDGQPARVDVSVGRSNETRVEVLAGLSEGDRVLLVPGEPAASGEAQAEQPKAKTKQPEAPKRPAADKTAAPKQSSARGLGTGGGGASRSGRGRRPPGGRRR